RTDVGLDCPERGAIAQLGERLDRTQEVAGSSPASSTPEPQRRRVLPFRARTSHVEEQRESPPMRAFPMTFAPTQSRTSTGTLLGVCVPFPSWPWVFWPQHLPAPALISAHV